MTPTDLRELKGLVRRWWQYAKTKRRRARIIKKGQCSDELIAEATVIESFADELAALIKRMEKR